MPRTELNTWRSNNLKTTNTRWQIANKQIIGELSDFLIFDSICLTISYRCLAFVWIPPHFVSFLELSPILAKGLFTLFNRWKMATKGVQIYLRAIMIFTFRCKIPFLLFSLGCNKVTLKICKTSNIIFVK